jgi:glycosyltransferase involved in cell wall biosynthesis
LILVVDNPRVSPNAAACLAAMQARMLHRLRVRRHARNLGAPAARNRALEESLAEYVVGVFVAPLPPHARCQCLFAVSPS